MKKLKHILLNMKVRYKMILVYLIVGVLPFMFASMFFYGQVRNLIIEEEYLSSSNYINQASQSFDNSLKIYNSLSDYLSFDQTISNTLSYSFKDNYELYQQITKGIAPSINSIKYFHNDVNKITIYTSNHNIKYDNILAPISEIKDEPWYETLTPNATWFSNEEEGYIYSVRKMPLLDRKQIDSVLFIEINYDDAFQYFKSQEFSNYDVFICDDNEKLIYEYHNNKDLSYKEFLKYYKNNKDSKNIITQKSNETGWTIYFYRSDMSNERRLNLIILMIMVVSMITGIIACTALMSTSQFIVGRIEKLLKNMKKVEKGDLDVDIVNKYDDEIGSLIKGFNKMVERIKQLIQDVYVEKLVQKEYEMRALQQQINPHFLYNTLSMINFKALEVGEEDISKITLALSAFYRTSLNKGKNTCTIKDEISNMKAYMDIQLMMHDNNFDFECVIDDDISTYETLNLILQPIVENCIKHGIDVIEDDRRGSIKVYITKYEGIVYFMIEDNGVGMDQETIDIMLSHNSKGYGMRNVNERIKLYYGEEYGLYIESVINVGTVITVKIPAKNLHD